MANVALLIGNTQYDTLPPLDCCQADVHAIKALLDATGKFDGVEVLINTDASSMKDRIRATVDAYDTVGEIFFYFTGHGFQHNEEFFFCSTDFSDKRPNATGLSNTELHTLLRSADADLVVKVIDACCSGVLLVKGDGAFLPTTTKNGFKNLIQIASCLDSQNSLTGDPLSKFTEKFRSAALIKPVGPIYYSDIVNVLRDEFLNNDSQTPHFVFQGTAREIFVENAKILDGLRSKLSDSLRDTVPERQLPSVTEQPDSIRDILAKAEGSFAKEETVKACISRLFDKLTTKASSREGFGELFDAEVVEHSDFREPTTKAFIIRVLSSEKRPDNFVSATLKPEYRRRDPFGNFVTSVADQLALIGHADDLTARYELKLNCELERAQLKITLTPKFVSLKRFVLVVSCAPSLEVCYVMEMMTQHPLMDWGVFDAEGTEVVRRWYKLKWTDPCDFLVDKICDRLWSAIRESVDAAAQALSRS